MPDIQASLEAQNFVQAARSTVRVGVQRRANFRSKKLPCYATDAASGFDIRAQLEEDVIIEPGDRALVPTGLSFEVPDGWELQARPRSGWALREGVSLLNSPGTIDADYRGEVKVLLINHGNEMVRVQDQMRICQMVLARADRAMFVEAALSSSARGTGGFGSTGTS